MNKDKIRSETMKRNLTMLADFYEFTMSNAYLEIGKEDTIAIFDLYFRKVPDNGAFAIAAGLESAIDYIKNLNFSEEDLNYLRSKGKFSEKFLAYLKNMKFECDIWAVPDGTVVFPNEPLIIVKGPIIQAQILETMLLICMNHQSLIATKASRIVRSAQGKPVMEFGSRRAQGPDAANLGAKSAYLAGCIGTANALSDVDYKVPALGTMAHSWITMFDSEYEAFCAYAKTYPNDCTLLVDTYDTLKSGVPNAIRCFDDILKPMGIRPMGIRLDSGDMAYLSKVARRMLDESGYYDCQIVASNSLDENRIQDLLVQGAKIDSFGVGENLITAKSNPVFGGVYKLVAIEKNGEIIPKIKISENVEKITTPGLKFTYRIYDNKTNMAEADLTVLADEEINEEEALEIFHPIHTWKRKVFTNFTAKVIQKKIFEKGELIYDIPTLDESRQFCKREVDSLWEEHKRLDNPHIYKVDLSEKLWNLKNNLIKEVREDTQK